LPITVAGYTTIIQFRVMVLWSIADAAGLVICYLFYFFILQDAVRPDPASVRHIREQYRGITP